MSRLVRRYRNILTSAVLGLWGFTVFVGIANACTGDGVAAVPHPRVTAVPTVGGAIDDDIGHGPEDFCGSELPLLGVPQPVHDQPAGQPPVVATHHDLGALPISASTSRFAQTAHPLRGVPFSLRIVRLTL